MKRITLIAITSLIVTNFLSVNANAGTYCADGTYSYSSGSGTCSWHGGIMGGAPSSKKSYGSSLNDPWSSNSYGSFGSKKCYSIIC